MSDFPLETILEAALRNGLRSLSVPNVSADFDERILVALHRPKPLWLRLWQPARPLLAGASFSLLVTLVGLHWSLSAPLNGPPAPNPVGAREEQILAAHPVPSLETLLDRPNLTAGSLAYAWNAPSIPTPQPGTRPEPRRRASNFYRQTLVV
jgi:hypothetical protein